MSPRQPIFRDQSIGILCPYCGSAKNRVTHKNPLIGRAARRHICGDCAKPFYTDQYVRPSEAVRTHINTPTR